MMNQRDLKLKSTIIELPYATITFRKEGFIYLHYKGCLHTLEESRKLFAIIKSNSPWSKCPYLVSEDDFFAQDQNARLFNQSHEVVRHITAKAFIVKNTAQKIAFNLYMKLFSKQVPVRYFSSEHEALEWLNLFIPLNELITNKENIDE